MSNVSPPLASRQRRLSKWQAAGGGLAAAGLATLGLALVAPSAQAAASGEHIDSVSLSCSTGTVLASVTFSNVKIGDPHKLTEMHGGAYYYQGTTDEVENIYADSGTITWQSATPDVTDATLSFTLVRTSDNTSSNVSNPLSNPCYVPVVTPPTTTPPTTTPPVTTPPTTTPPTTTPPTTTPPVTTPPVTTPPVTTPPVTTPPVTTPPVTTPPGSSSSAKIAYKASACSKGIVSVDVSFSDVKVGDAYKLVSPQGKFYYQGTTDEVENIYADNGDITWQSAAPITDQASINVTLVHTADNAKSNTVTFVNPCFVPVTPPGSGSGSGSGSGGTGGSGSGSGSGTGNGGSGTVSGGSGSGSGHGTTPGSSTVVVKPLGSVVSNSGGYPVGAGTSGQGTSLFDNARALSIIAGSTLVALGVLMVLLRPRRAKAGK